MTRCRVKSLRLLPPWSGCHGCALLPALAALSFSGCQQPPSVMWRPTTDEPPHEKAWLTNEEQREVHAALAGVAADHQPLTDPHPRPIDWRDIRRVLDAACSDVFMAVAEVTTVDESTRCYRLRTLNEKSASISITRVGDGFADVHAEATVGLFGDETDRAAELVQSFQDRYVALRDRRLAEAGQAK